MYQLYNADGLLLATESYREAIEMYYEELELGGEPDLYMDGEPFILSTEPNAHLVY
jgi:hypothetical protein